MKKLELLKVLIVLFLLFSFLFSIVNIAEAKSQYDWSGKISNFDKTTGDATVNNKVTSIVGAAISVIRIVGVGVAIIMLTAVAIKYMSSAPGERAEIKKHAVPFVVGAVVLFASSGILSIIQQFADNI